MLPAPMTVTIISASIECRFLNYASVEVVLEGYALLLDVLEELDASVVQRFSRRNIPVGICRCIVAYIA